jgi:release factor glutamine methyltransferase
MLEEKTRVWTIRDLMLFAINHLQRRGFDEARLTVELLLAHALQCPRIQLYSNYDKPLTPEELKEFRHLYERRLNREPVQYIVGSTSFMGLSFQVDPRVLIPRPETETLVEQVMMLCRDVQGSQGCSILEAGTGSGNIAISVAKFIKGSKVWSIDVSEDALEVARANAERHGITDRVVFHHMDVFEPVDQLLLKRFDLFVSNPPYVSAAEWEGLPTEIRRFEPRVAVSDWKDGFEFARRFIELAPFVLRNEGYLLMEIGFGQADHVMQLMRDAGFSNVSAANDLEGTPRVVIATVASKTRNQGFVN